MPRASGFDYKVTGLEDTRRYLNRLSGTVDQIAITSPQSILGKLSREIANSVPVDTGHLRSNIYVIPLRNGQAKLETRSYKSHPGSIEYGTPTGRRHGYAASVEKGKPNSRTAGTVFAKPLQKMDLLIDEVILQKIDRAVKS